VGLLQDSTQQVVEVAARTAGRLQNRMYLDGLLHMLAYSRLRPHASRNEIPQIRMTLPQGRFAPFD
jgi:hypothetical protein